MRIHHLAGVALALVSITATQDPIGPGDSPTTRQLKACTASYQQGMSFCEVVMNGDYGPSPHYQQCKAAITERYFECVESTPPSQQDLVYE